MAPLLANNGNFITNVPQTSSASCVNAVEKLEGWRNTSKVCTMSRGEVGFCSISQGDGQRATRALELVHSDVAGPLPVSSWGGANFAVSFTDDYFIRCNMNGTPTATRGPPMSRLQVQRALSL